jgi:hypothetical protein
LVNVVPGDVSVGTCRTTVKSMLDPAAKDAAVHVIVPPLPGAGVEQGNAAVIGARETNVNPAGIASVRVTDAASSGPPFVTLIVNVTSELAAALSGPVFKTRRSLSWAATVRQHRTNVSIARPPLKNDIL